MPVLVTSFGSTPPRRGRALTLLRALVLAGLASSKTFAAPPYAEEWTVPGTPEDVDVDPLGRVWVSCNDDSVRVYEPTGGVLLFSFGGSGTGDGQFQDPFGIQFAGDGTVYICDYLGARVERFADDGTFLHAWPVPSDRADHVAIDAVGDVYVTGFPDLSVHKYDASGTPLFDWPSQGGGKTSGILVVGDVVHVTQWDVPEVEQFTLDGAFLGSFPIETAFAVDIEQDAFGQLWVADWSNAVVRVFSAAGEPLETLGEPGAGPGQFDGPIGIAFGLEGSVYIADQGNGRVQRFGASVTGVHDPAHGPNASVLHVISPNPFRDAVTFSYSVPHAERAALTIADVRGRRVATLQDRFVAAGEHRFTWNARSDGGLPVAPGRYFLQLEHDGNVNVAALTLLR